MSEIKLDPLYSIFEKHLYSFTTEATPIKGPRPHNDHDFREAIIESVVTDYLNFLEKSQVIIPRQWASQVRDELKDQVRSMLVKKTYGCVTIGEFIKGQKDLGEKKRTSRKKAAKYGG